LHFCIYFLLVYLRRVFFLSLNSLFYREAKVNQLETCPKCGARDTVLKKKGFFDVLECAFCGYDFEILTPQKQKKVVPQVEIAQQNTAALSLKGHSVIGSATIEIVLCMFFSAVFVLDIFFGMPRTLVVVSYLGTATLLALWMKYCIARKLMGTAVLYGACMLLFLFAGWTRWIDFRLISLFQ